MHSVLAFKFIVCELSAALEIHFSKMRFMFTVLFIAILLSFCFYFIFIFEFCVEDLNLAFCETTSREENIHDNFKCCINNNGMKTEKSLLMASIETLCLYFSVLRQ
jgi:hypothetical protein